MKIQVYVKDAVFTINCGNGVQKIKWLAQFGACKYDRNGMMKSGQPKLVKLEDGTFLNMNDRICQRLLDNARIWILFDDYSETLEKNKDKKGLKKIKK